MKFSFDLCKSKNQPANDFRQWVPQWWYRNKGFPIQKGVLSNGNQWLLVGWFLSEEKTEKVVQRFVKQDDAEVLFQADGQFILAIFLQENNTVSLYRDRIGILPFVFAEGKGGLCFSVWFDNSIKLSGVNLAPSEILLEQWVVFRKTFAPYTPFRCINSIPSSSFVKVRNKNVEQCVHHLKLPADKKFRNLGSASRELGKVIQSAVRKRLSDVRKPGILLSGGLDSSLIVALARESFFGALKTLFIGFEGNALDYSDYAAQVGKMFETDHSVLYLNPGAYLNHWAKTIAILQTPVPMPCHVAISAAMDELQGEVTSVLAGDGADTVFGASFWPQALFLSYLSRFFPRAFRDITWSLRLRLGGETAVRKAISIALTALSTNLQDYPHISSSIIGKEECDKVFHGSLWEKGVNFRKKLVRGKFFESLFSYLMLHGIPEDIGTGIRLGISRGIFVSFPFLDYDLIRTSMLMPTWIRYHFTNRKAVLNHFALRYFDKKFIHKPKEGFGVPLSKWFAKKEFEPFLKLPLEERSLKRGWWKDKYLKPIIDSHLLGDGTDSTAEGVPWIVTNLELWMRICIEGDSPSLYK